MVANCQKIVQTHLCRNEGQSNPLILGICVKATQTPSKTIVVIRQIKHHACSIVVSFLFL